MALPAPPSAQTVLAWLQQAGRQVLPKFPPEMEALYTAETRAERERDQFEVTMYGAVAGLLLFLIAVSYLSKQAALRHYRADTVEDLV